MKVSITAYFDGATQSWISDLIATRFGDIVDEVQSSVLAKEVGLPPILEDGYLEPSTGIEISYDEDWSDEPGGRSPGGAIITGESWTLRDFLWNSGMMNEDIASDTEHDDKARWEARVS